MRLRPPLRRLWPRTHRTGTAPEGSTIRFPEIWLASFRDAGAWSFAAERRESELAVLDAIDDRLLVSRHPFDIRGWCVVCGSVQTMAMAWHHVGSSHGSVNPAWTLNACCHGCRLVSRMRALIELLKDRPEPVEHAYVAERVTECFPVLERLFPSIVGSEFLGDDRTPGVEYPHESGISVRHEDLGVLSFDAGTFDLVITQDVFEHVPNYRLAFRECRRVLRPGGRLVFTVPFFADAAVTEVRAVVEDDGTVRHLLPPEIHGSPVSDGGSLCFQHFGWDMLDDLRSAGFDDAQAHLYWGPWSGHLGHPMFVFEARTTPKRRASGR